MAPARHGAGLTAGPTRCCRPPGEFRNPGASLTSSTFAELQASDDPAEKDKIMHSMLTTEGEMVLMASDTPSQMDYTPGNNFSISLSGEGR